MVKAYQQPNSVGMSVAESQAQYDAFMRYCDYPLEPYRQESSANNRVHDAERSLKD
jgi:hypothetical protein